MKWEILKKSIDAVGRIGRKFRTNKPSKKIKTDEVYKQYCIPIVAFLPSINNKPESKVPNNLPAALATRTYCLYINSLKPIGFG